MKLIAAYAELDAGRSRQVEVRDVGTDPPLVNVRVDAPGERAVSVSIPLEEWRNLNRSVEAHYAPGEGR